MSENETSTLKYSKRQWIIMALFCVAQLCNALCISIQAPFYPKEAEEKGATPTEYGFVFGIYELTIFFFSPLYGKFISHIGAKVLNNTGLFTVGFTAILFGLLDKIKSKNVFVAYSFIIRITEATGTSAFITAAFSIIASEFTENIGSAFAALETFFGVGLILGPTVGGILYEAGGFMLPFTVVGCLLLATAVLIFILLPTPKEPQNTEQKGGILNLISKFPIFLDLMTIFGASYSIGLIQATLEPHIRPLNLTALQIGLMFMINGATYAISAPFWGKMCDKYFTSKKICLVGTALICIAFILMGPAPYLPIDKTLTLVIVALIIHGFGMGAQLVATFSGLHRETIAREYPDDIGTYGLVSGIWTSSFALGAFVGPSLGGVLLEAFGFAWTTQSVLFLHAFIFITTFIYICRNGKKYSKVTLVPISPSPSTSIEETRPILRRTNSEIRSTYGSLGPKYL